MVTSKESQIISSVISMMKKHIEISKSNAVFFLPDFADSINDSFSDLENSILEVELVISNNFSDGSIKSLQPPVYSTFISCFEDIVNNIRKTMELTILKKNNNQNIAVSMGVDFYEIQDAKYAFVNLYNQIHWPK